MLHATAEKEYAFFLILRSKVTWINSERNFTCRKELRKIANSNKCNIIGFYTRLYKLDKNIVPFYKSKVIYSFQKKFLKIKRNAGFASEKTTFLKETKFGVDAAEQMARKCNLNACSRKQFLDVFYNILNLATINAGTLQPQ